MPLVRSNYLALKSGNYQWFNPIYIYIYIYKSKVGDHSRGWPEGSLFDSLLHQGVGEGATPFPGLLHFTLDPYLIMLSVKQRGIKYHFLSLWYDSTWDWTQVSRAIGEHSNRSANVRTNYISCHTTSMDTLTLSHHPSLSSIASVRSSWLHLVCIDTELLYIGSSWSSCLCSSIWRGPREYVTYEFVLTSPVLSRMAGSSNLDSFRDGL